MRTRSSRRKSQGASRPRGAPDSSGTRARRPPPAARFPCPPRGTIRCARWSRQSPSPRGRAVQRYPAAVPRRISPAEAGCSAATRRGRPPRRPEFRKETAGFAAARGRCGRGCGFWRAESPFRGSPPARPARIAEAGGSWLSGADCPSPAHGEAAPLR